MTLTPPQKVTTQQDSVYRVIIRTDLVDLFPMALCSILSATSCMSNIHTTNTIFSIGGFSLQLIGCWFRLNYVQTEQQRLMNEKITRLFMTIKITVFFQKVYL